MHARGRLPATGSGRARAAGAGLDVEQARVNPALPAESKPMIAHIAEGRTDLVVLHLAQGGSPEAADAQGVTLMQWCAYYGDVSAMRCLLARGASLASLGENLDLNGAAFHGHDPLCQFLLEHNADPNHPLADTGETPLHAALCKVEPARFDRVVEVLLAAGADPNRRTIPGVETGAFMRDCRTRGETSLHRAAAYGSEHVIDLLLKAGGAVEARDANGDSPLTWASWHHRPASILRKLCFGRWSIHPKAT